MTDAAFPYEGPDALRPVVDTALRSVLDPEVALNIVDVGLIYGVTARDGKVEVRMTMTSAACPVTDVIVDDVEQALDRTLPPEWLIQVRLVWEPPWTPERMSGHARRFMGG